MDQLKSAQRDKLFYYTPDREHINGNESWLLISFKNQWFNVIDLRSILHSLDYINPYKDLQIGWLYPQPPQKIFQSLYKETLQEVDFNLWIRGIIPNFDKYTERCHCQSEFRNETRVHGHLVSGKFPKMIISSYGASMAGMPRSRRIHIMRSATALLHWVVTFVGHKSWVNHATDLRLIYSDRSRYIRTRILDMLTRSRPGCPEFNARPLNRMCRGFVTHFDSGVD
jgi:hypothetical protein